MLVEMRSVSALHLEMFLSGSSLSGFFPHFVLSLSCPCSCYSSTLWRRIEQVCAASLLTDIEELGGDVEQIFLFLFLFFFSPSRSVWRMRTVGIDMICFIFWEILAVTTTK